MPPIESDREAVACDAPPFDIPRMDTRPLSREVQLPLLGTKRCTTCHQRRAIKGGTQKGGRFVCLACLATRAI